MSRAALVDTATGRVLNVIEVDGTFQPEEGFTLIAADAIAVSPGDLWDGMRFSPGMVPEPIDVDAELAAAIEAATTLEELKIALLGKVRPAKVAAKQK